MTTNAKVSTPLGVGVAQGPFAVVDGDGNLAAAGVLVRLPVNDVTVKALKESNCMTPRAQVSGLWVFRLSEIQGAV